MPKTLLDGVNDVAKKLQLIKGSVGEFTVLTGLAQQYSVDVIISNWNVAIEELYEITSKAYPNELATADIVLVNGQRAYDLPSNSVAIRWPLHNLSNGEFIYWYEPGFEELRLTQQIPDDEVGRPLYGVIRPTDGKLYFDKIPGSAENGDVYELQYDRDVSMSVKNDTVPFNDAVYRPMVNAVAELTRRDIRNRFDAGFYRKYLAQAGRYLNKNVKNNSYIKQTGASKARGLDPYNA